MTRLLTVDRELRDGNIVERPNRFVIRARIEDEVRRIFLGDPGALEGIVEPGHQMLCAPAADPDRATDFDAIAVAVDETFVSVRASLANDLFERALARDAIPRFSGYSVRRREPELPDHGRTDFLLETPAGDVAYVEVKSCTSAEAGVAKFPDRQTARGRRHLRSLAALRADGDETHVVFVVQRPDVDRLAPYATVDPEFAELLVDVADEGVGVHAISTTFEPPDYRLVKADLPIDLRGNLD